MKHLVWCALLLFGCRADDLVKQGEVGELCNGSDDDCRPGLVCALGACAEGDGPQYSCGDVCRKLADCEAAEPTCEADCRITTTRWELRAREEFGRCVVEDLTCELAQTVDSPQYCYSRIEIPAERFSLCEETALQVLDCSGSTEQAESVLEGCAAVARVRPEDVWIDAATCASSIETGICAEVGTCFTGE